MTVQDLDTPTINLINTLWHVALQVIYQNTHYTVHPVITNTFSAFLTVNIRRVQSVIDAQINTLFDSIDA